MTAGLPRRVRADLWLVERGLFESRARAQAARGPLRRTLANACRVCQ